MEQIQWPKILLHQASKIYGNSHVKEAQEFYKFDSISGNKVNPIKFSEIVI